MRGVIDRIVDQTWAVILVGDDEIEFKVPLDKLPNDIREGSIVKVTIDNDVILRVDVLEDETTATQTELSEKMKKLKSRMRSNFKRND